MNPMNGILSDVKNFLNADTNTNDFDGEILPHISSAIMTLNQNGVCKNVFVDNTTKWRDITNDGQENNPDYLNGIPLFVMMSTKMFFDPPPPSTIPYYQSGLAEKLWRLKISYETDVQS